MAKAMVKESEKVPAKSQNTGVATTTTMFDPSKLAEQAGKLTESVKQEVGQGQPGFVKFVSGTREYAGPDDFKADHRFIVNTVGIYHKKIKWKEGEDRPVAEVARNLLEKPEFIQESELDDVGPGEEWSDSVVFIIKDQETGSEYSLVSSNKSSSNSFKQFIGNVFDPLNIDRLSTELPVVELSSAFYKHKVHKSTIHYPVINLVDWVPMDEVVFQTPVLSSTI